MAVLRGSLSAAILALLTLIAGSAATRPLIGWSNREIFYSVSNKDVVDAYSFIGRLHDDLKQLDFVVVFSTEKLTFDNIAKYGGVYGDKGTAYLSGLQGAVESAESSVWVGLDRGSLTDEIHFTTNTIPIYHTTYSPPLQKSSSMQLVVVYLSSEGQPEMVFTEHNSKITEVMKLMESERASYAAFYTESREEQEEQQVEEKPYITRFSRSAFAAESNSSSNATFPPRQVCNRTAAIYTYNSSANGSIQYCMLLCIQSTEMSTNPGSNETRMRPIKALYWPSWRDLLVNTTTDDKKNKTCPLRCNMTSFEFDKGSGQCNMSSLQEEYSVNGSISSSSIRAQLSGMCGRCNTTEEEPIPISLDIEFIFFKGWIPLPRGQYLPQQFWTMQLVVNETLNNTDCRATYMTRFRTDHELDKNGLFYPFTVPFSSSYACTTNKDHLLLSHGNLNRFVVSKSPFKKPNSSDSSGFDYFYDFTDDLLGNNATSNMSDGPVLQFIGLHVQAFGEVYRLTNNRTVELVFDSIYYCEGYFDISSLMGTFVVLIVVIFLYLSSICIFAMQTVDRFDDPRGQTITVENLH